MIRVDYPNLISETIRMSGLLIYNLTTKNRVRRFRLKTSIQRMKLKPPSNIGGFLFYLIFIDMKIIIRENKIDSLIEKSGIVQTIKLLGGYKNFDKIYPDYFYSEGSLNRERVINFLNECVEVNVKIENETNIYLYDYWDSILFQTWSDYNEEAGRDFQYESRISSFTTDLAHYEVWEYDEEGEMFDEAYDYGDIALNRLENKFLFNIFNQLWGHFKL